MTLKRFTIALFVFLFIGIAAITTFSRCAYHKTSEEKAGQCNCICKE